MSRHSPMQELVEVLSGDTRQVRLLSVILMYCAAGSFIGLQLKPDPRALEDMRLLLYVLPAWGWATLFALIAGLRAVGVLMWSGNLILRIVIPFVGLCLWVACFASNVIGNPDEANFSILYLVAGSMEVWLFGRAAAELREVLHGR